MHLSIPDRCHGIVDKCNTENQLIKVIPVEKELIIEFGKITFRIYMIQFFKDRSRIKHSNKEFQNQHSNSEVQN